MSLIAREQIRSAVIDVIRSLARKSDLAISEDDSINFGTLLYGDDFGNLFIIEIEDLLGIRPSVREWPKVYTVGDAVDLLVRVVEGR